MALRKDASMAAVVRQGLGPATPRVPPRALSTEAPEWSGVCRLAHEMECVAPAGRGQVLMGRINDAFLTGELVGTMGSSSPTRKNA